MQIHSSLYRNPELLPAGAVLVVGSGQSGCQIAEDLHIAGRKVHLCVGDAPRVARRYRGKDVVEWLHLMGYYDLPVHEHPLREGVRDKTNHYVTGRDGGRDIDLRQRALEGMELYGRLLDVVGDRLVCATIWRLVSTKPIRFPRASRPALMALLPRQAISAPEEDRYRPGVGAAARAAAVRLPRGWHHFCRLVYRLSHRLQLDRPAAVQWPRPTEPCARRDAGPRRLLCRFALALHLGLGPVLGRSQRRRISSRTHQGANSIVWIREATGGGQRGGDRVIMSMVRLSRRAWVISIVRDKSRKLFQRSTVSEGRHAPTGIVAFIAASSSGCVRPSCLPLRSHLRTNFDFLRPSAAL